ncbi:PepSY domain-containing protein [Lysinibacillus parviboronicapiens]|uniref:PepSY domain-containing protein n=1 Tax=Lysinibacillus parviboronicapiens TaxID=436516 RepID=UPI001F2A89C6|nr:PepSY domain-containing protein [Lysinibacillus parviboronicapiens]
MMKKWTIPVSIMIILCSFSLWFLQDRFFRDKPLGEAEAISRIEELYNGQVEHIKKRGENYEIVFFRGGATYAIELNQHTQQVSNLKIKKPANKLLTEQEIRPRALAHTPGMIDSVTLTDTTYMVQIKKEDMVKKLTLDAYTGKVLTEVEVQQVTEPDEGTSVISKQQAIQIALQQLNGEVDSVDYEKTEDGGYYLVEIETDKDEAVFQIHAVSGKVLSVTWDNDH